MDEATAIRLEAIPLYQDIEQGHGEAHFRFKIIPKIGWLPLFFLKAHIRVDNHSVSDIINQLLKDTHTSAVSQAQPTIKSR